MCRARCIGKGCSAMVLTDKLERMLPGGCLLKEAQHTAGGRRLPSFRSNERL